MNKLNGAKIKYGMNLSFKILTLLAFAMVFVPFDKAAAQIQTTGCSQAGCNYIYTSPAYVNTAPQPQVVVAPQPQPVYIAPEPVTPVVYYTNPNPTTIVKYVPTTVAKAKTTTPKTVAVAPATTTPATTPATNTDTGSNLAANAIYGSNGFLPSGLIQWILFAIAILLIVILARRIFGAKAKYQASPLKHE